MDKFNDLKTKRDIAFNSVGIYAIDENFNDGATQIASVVGSVSQKAHEQLNYNLLINKPCKIQVKNPIQHAIKRGLIATISQYLDYDIKDVRLFCAELLEDVNDHEEASIMCEKST